MKEIKDDFSDITNPSHYCDGRKYEPKDVIRDWNLNFNLGNVVKYVSRAGRKAGSTAMQDLLKAKQYLEFELEALREFKLDALREGIFLTTEQNEYFENLIEDNSV